MHMSPPSASSSPERFKLGDFSLTLTILTPIFCLKATLETRMNMYTVALKQHAAGLKIVTRERCAICSTLVHYSCMAVVCCALLCAAVRCCVLCAVRCCSPVRLFSPWLRGAGRRDSVAKPCVTQCGKTWAGEP